MPGRKIAGLCVFDQTVRRCKARDEADCQASDSCKSSGICSFRKGYCVGTKPEDCARSEQCTEAGRCSFKELGLAPCHAASNKDCAGSKGCKRHGRCSAVTGSCRVMTAKDCAGSEMCTEHGQQRYNKAVLQAHDMRFRQAYTSSRWLRLMGTSWLPSITTKEWVMASMRWMLMA